MAQCKFCGNECENLYCEQCQEKILTSALEDKELKNILWRIFRTELMDKTIAIRSMGMSTKETLEALFGKIGAELVLASTNKFDEVYQKYADENGTIHFKM